MYNNQNEKSMVQLLAEQMDAAWKLAYMLIDQKPTAGDRWEWIGSEEKGYQVFLNRKLVSSDPQVVAKLQMIAYLDEQFIKQMDATWRVVYMLIDRKPTAGDRWEWIGSEEKGFQVFLNRKLVSTDPQLVAKLQMIRYLDPLLRAIGGDDNGAI